MSKDMLAPIIRALVGVPQDCLGVLFDTVNKFGGDDGPLWRSRFAEVLREGVKNRQEIQDLVRVDRNIRPAYPDWMRKLFNPELEQTGPTEYQLGSLQLSLHPKQEQGVATGHEVFEHQQKLGPEGCLSLADLLAIQKLGIETFRRHFKGKAVFGWKSVVQDDDGRLGVPCLLVLGGQVEIYWRWLGNDWDAGSPALRFAK